jgi:hypothetical protein
VFRNLRFKVKSLGLMVSVLGFMIYGLKCMPNSLVTRVEVYSLGLRVLGLWFRV